MLQVRVFDLTDGNGFRCLHQVDISKAIGKEKDAKRSKQMETGTGLRKIDTHLWESAL